jgi:hypothetical protein
MLICWSRAAVTRGSTFQRAQEGNENESLRMLRAGGPGSLFDCKPNLRTGGSRTMLWTILIILAIVALALFIFSRVRGGRSRL